MPYLGRFLGAQIIGTISSILRAKDIVGPLALQKFNAAFSFVLPAAGPLTEDALKEISTMEILHNFNRTQANLIARPFR